MTNDIAAAKDKLDAHVREIIAWHFSPETGCPFWLDWLAKAGWNPIEEVRSYEDIKKFPHFEDEWLRDLPNDVWVPKTFQGRPYFIFETGGTTGMPKQRIGWEDHLRDYEEFSETLSDEFFPRGGNWLMLGPRPDRAAPSPAGYRTSRARSRRCLLSRRPRSALGQAAYRREKRRDGEEI
jgi:hypothetical protein